MPHLETWRQLAKQAEDMAGIAEAHDWDKLIEIDKRFRDAITAARTSVTPALSLDERNEKKRLIQQIMRHQEAVREHIAPWMTHVKPLLDAFSGTRAEAHSNETRS